MASLLSPPYSVGQQRILGFIKGADFNSTADQAINIGKFGSKFLVTGFIVTNASASLTLAAGGLYSAASKGGTAVVLAAQVYSALTGSAVVLQAPISTAGASVALTVSQLFLSLTTAQGSAATADVYVLGVDLI